MRALVRFILALRLTVLIVLPALSTVSLNAQVPVLRNLRAAVSASLGAQSGPVVTSIDPPSVLAGSGATTVTLYGSSFTPATTVSSGGNLPVNFISGSSISVTIPANRLTAPGTINLVVQDGSSSSSAYFYVASPSPPSVSAINPAGGVRGTNVSICLGGTGGNWNLYGASVSFSGSGLTVTPPISGGCFTVSIAPDAPFGPHQVTISTLSGSTSSCGPKPCTFTVVDAGSWTDVSTQNLPYTLPGPVIRLLDGRLLVIGGSLYANPSRPAEMTPVASVQIFDPVTLQWTSTGSLLNSQTPAAACLLPDGRVLAVRASPQPSEIYDPVPGTWSLTGTMTSSIAGRALLLASGKVFVSYNTDVFGAELFDPDTGRFQDASQFTTRAAIP